MCYRQRSRQKPCWNKQLIDRCNQSSSALTSETSPLNQQCCIKKYFCQTEHTQSVRDIPIFFFFFFFAFCPFDFYTIHTCWRYNTYSWDISIIHRFSRSCSVGAIILSSFRPFPPPILTCQFHLIILSLLHSFAAMHTIEWTKLTYIYSSFY